MPSSAAPTSRIVVVEDDPIVRDHFIEILSAAPDLDLAGCAGSIAQARELLHLQPELFLLDLGLPDGSGLDFVGVIKDHCDARVLIVTSFGDRETVVAAIRAGADGYLLKDSDPAAIVDGIRVTLGGGAPISAAAAVYLLENLRSRDAGVTVVAEQEDGLTPREIELLKIFAKGSSYKQAARVLGISPLTVGNYVKSIYRKLAVHSRGEAVYEAVKTGQLRI